MGLLAAKVQLAGLERVLHVKKVQNSAIFDEKNEKIGIFITNLVVYVAWASLAVRRGALSSATTLSG